MKKSIKTLKKATALMLCLMMCLAIVPAYAAEVGADLLNGRGSMDSQTTIGSTNVDSKFYYADTESAKDSNNKVPGFSKVSGTAMTQIAPTIIKETGTENNVIAMGYDTTGEALTTTSSNFYDAVKIVGALQVWETDVMLPDVTVGTTALFYYGVNGNDWWMSGADSASSVMIKKDKVYLITPADNVASQSHGVELPMDKNLEANKWYKFVRVMDFSTKPNMQKVYVYEKAADGNYTLIGKTADWAKASGNTSGSGTTIRARAYFVKGYSASVLFDNVKAYKAEFKLDNVSLEGGGNNVALLDATTSTEISLAARANWLYSLEHDYSIRLKLPEVTEGSQIKLFAMGYENDTYLFTNDIYTDTDIRYNAKLNPYSSVIVISGGTVYSNVYDGTNTNKTVIKNKNGEDLVLEANKWYTFDVHGLLGSHSKSGTTYVSAEDAGKYTISVKENGAEIATANIVKETYANKSVGKFYPLTLISAKNFGKAIYFDDIKAEAGYTTTTAYDIAGVNADFESVEAGSALGDVLKSSDMKGTYKLKGSGFTASNAYVASDFSGTYLDGTVTSMELDPLNIKFSAPINEDTFNMDTVVFKANGEALEEGYSLSYDAETFTGTVTFDEPLEYNTAYTIEILPSICSETYGLPLTAGASYSFSTPEDNFTIDNMKFQKQAEEGYEDVADLTAKFTSGDKVRANVSMTNTSLEKRDYLVICAVFSKDNKMLDIKVNSDKIDPGAVLTGDTAVVTEPVTVSEADARVEIYVWDNWTKIMPKIDKVVAPEQTAN